MARDATMEAVRRTMGTRLANELSAGTTSKSIDGTMPSPDTSSAGGTTPVPFEHRHVGPMPVVADRDAMAVLGTIRGESVIEETESAISLLDSEIDRFLASMNDAHSVREALNAVPKIFERRSVYRLRLDAWRRHFGLPASTIPNPRDLPRIDPSDLHPDFERSIARRLATVSVQVDNLERQIETYSNPMSQDWMYSAQTEPVDQSKGGVRLGLPLHPQDACLERLSIWCRQLRELKATQAALQRDASHATELVKARVVKAVSAAGGVDDVVFGAVAAGALMNPATPWGEIERRLRDAADELRKLAIAGITDGHAHDAATNKARDAAIELTTAKNAEVARRRAAAETMVDRAMAGEEVGRAQLEQLANAYPSAFGDGFNVAIAEARHDRAALAELMSTFAP